MIRLRTDPHDRASIISAMASLDRRAHPPQPARSDDSNDLAKSYYSLVRSALGAGVPGGWASDHYEETLHFTGWNYIAGHVTALQSAGATVEVSRPAGSVDAWSGKGFRKKFPRVGKHSGRERYFQVVRECRLAKSHEQDQLEEREVMPEEFGLVKLVNRPNPSQSGGHLRYEISVQLSQTGTALVVKIPNRFGKTVELYTVPTCLMTPRPPSTQFPRGAYYVSPAATRTNWADDSFVTMVGYQRLAGTTIDMRDLIKISFPHPLWKDEGYSAMAAGALWTDSSEQIDRARFMKMMNQADPSLIVTPPQDVNPNDNEIARVMHQMATNWAGAKNAGKIAVAPGGSEITTVGTNPKDMDFSNGFDQLGNAIMGLHGVPLIAAGITAGGSYAAFYAALKQFITLTVQPRLDWIAEELTYQLAEQYGDGLMIRLIAASVDDPQVLESQLATDISARSIKKNEVRQLRGLEPVDDGDVWVGETFTESVRVNSPDATPGADKASNDRSTGISTGQDAPRSPAQHFEGVRAAGSPQIGKSLKRLEKRVAKLAELLNAKQKKTRPRPGRVSKLPKAIAQRLKGLESIQQNFGRLESLIKAAPDPILRQTIKDAAAETDTDPTEAEKQSGGYKKGRFRWNGLQIVIENPKGSVRRGRDDNGRSWEQKMGAHYGYLSRTEGADGDHLDVFIGSMPESEAIFVVDQVQPGGVFNEHKAVIGAINEDEAREIYLSCYQDGWRGLGAITAMTLEQFKAWAMSRPTDPLALPATFMKSWRETRGHESQERSSGFSGLAKAMELAGSHLWNGGSEGRNYP